MVFLTIAGTVVLAGVTAKPLARLLGVGLPGRDTIGILGIPGLGLMLGEALREAGRPIVFLDANPQHCRVAEEQGFNVVYGNALQDRTLQRARFELVGTAIGMTGNDSLNFEFVRAASELFNVPAGIAAHRREDSSGDVVGLFTQPHDLERWDVRIRHDMTVRETWRFAGESEPADAEKDGAQGTGQPGASERFVMLLVQRGRKTFPTSRDYRPRPGDLVSVVIHTQDLEDAYTELGTLGYEPAREKDEKGD